MRSYSLCCEGSRSPLQIYAHSIAFSEQCCYLLKIPRKAPSPAIPPSPGGIPEHTSPNPSPRPTPYLYLPYCFLVLLVPGFEERLCFVDQISQVFFLQGKGHKELARNKEFCRRPKIFLFSLMQKCRLLCSSTPPL